MTKIKNSSRSITRIYLILPQMLLKLWVDKPRSMLVLSVMSHMVNPQSSEPFPASPQSGSDSRESVILQFDWGTPMPRYINVPLALLQIAINHSQVTNKTTQNAKSANQPWIFKDIFHFVTVLAIRFSYQPC